MGVDLQKNSNGVRIYVNIYLEYQRLVKNDSVFWNNSGLRIDAGLFSGIKVATESIESLLSGGISMATPEFSKRQSSSKEGGVFTLEGEVDDKWLSWKPGINLRD